MLFIARPTDQEIHARLAAREAMPFSYSEVGATRSTAPEGYRINHMRALLGKGEDVQARAALMATSHRRRTRNFPIATAHRAAN